MLKSIYRRGQKGARTLESYAHIAKTWFGESAMIHKRRAEHRAVKLKPDQLRSLDSLWGENRLRRRRYEKWIRFYTKRTGKFDPNYMPEIVYSTRIEPRLVDHRRARILSDKALTEILFAGVPDVTIPRTLLVRSSGFYYGAGRQVISQQAASSLLYDAGKVFMKPSVGEAGGSGILSLDLQGGIDRASGCTVQALLRKDDRDFVFQEAITQHEAYSRLHPRSVNTVRVVTYILDGTICFWPTIMRIGMGGNVVDNAHADGIFIGVRDDGTLLPTATNMGGERFGEHPTTGVRFSGYAVPAIARMHAAAAKLHGRLPGIGLVSWDFALGEHGDVVLVEANLGGASVWLPQLAHGTGVFGENTRRALELARVVNVDY